jgi:hypothetical protein
MIRLTSFPILLAIAIYERQKFHHTSILDWIEKQLETHFGSGPRKFKNACECSSLFSSVVIWIEPCPPFSVIDSTGFDSFAGAGKDIDVVFEVEREVGDYYAGWDDDGDMDGDRVDPDQPIVSSSDSDDETTIKARQPVQPSQPIQIAESPNRNRMESPEQEPEDHDEHEDQASAMPFPRSKTIDETEGHSHTQAGSGRRRQSSPATSRHVAIASVAPDGLIQPQPRRRRDSIIEPSPLARLFVRSPTEDSATQSGFRRHVGSLSMSLAHPSHFGSSVFNDRLRQRRRSLAPTEDVGIGQKHPIGPIKEGQPASFRDPADKQLPDPPKSEEVKPRRDTIAKATAVENASATAGPTEVDGRLQAIEERQRRIEELLQQLVRATQSGREERRESAISLEM